MKDTFILKHWCLVNPHLQDCHLFLFYHYFFLQHLNWKERNLFPKKPIPGTLWTWSMWEQAKKYQLKHREAFEVRKKSSTGRSKPSVYWGTKPLRDLRKMLRSVRQCWLLLQKRAGIAMCCQWVNPGYSLHWQQWGPAHGSFGVCWFGSLHTSHWQVSGHAYKSQWRSNLILILIQN